MAANKKMKHKGNVQVTGRLNVNPAMPVVDVVKKKKRKRKKTKKEKEPEEANKAVVSFVSAATDSAAIPQECQSWFLYCTDPAGFHERFVKDKQSFCIPDGALDKGVRGENRQVDILSVPGYSSAAIPLDGRQWSLCIIKIGTFRLNFIAIASVYNAIFDTQALQLVVSDINDFTYETGVGDFPWRGVGSLVDDVSQYYWKPVFNQQTAALSEPVNGISTTVDKWRLVGSSITSNFNAPSLINQGIGVSGQYAREPQFKNQTLDLTEYLARLTFSRNGLTGSYQFYIRTAYPELNGTANIVITATPGPPVLVTPTIREATVIYNGITVATPDQTLRYIITDVGGGQINLAFNNVEDPLPTPPFISLNLNNFSTSTYLDVRHATETAEEVSSSFTTVNIPPTINNGIASTDPNYGYGTLVHTQGIYSVHQKTAAPVWEFANASTFGPMRLEFPGLITPEGGFTGGIRDTVDPNMGSIVQLFTGMSHAANILCTSITAWQGMPSQQSEVGQFAVAGGTICSAALNLYNVVAAEAPAVYRAEDNLGGGLMALLLKGLAALRSSKVTSSVIENGGRMLGKWLAKKFYKDKEAARRDYPTNLPNVPSAPELNHEIELD